MRDFLPRLKASRRHAWGRTRRERRDQRRCRLAVAVAQLDDERHLMISQVAPGGPGPPGPGARDLADGPPAVLGR